MTPEVEKNTPGGLLAARRHQNLGGLNMPKVPVNKAAMVCMFVCHQKCRTEEGVGNAQLRPSEALVN